MKVMLAVPTYGPVDPVCAKTVRIAMMAAVPHGVQWIGDASPDRHGWGTARNLVAKAAYDNRDSVDGVIWTDSDIHVPRDAYARLIDDTKRLGTSFVSGVYHQRNPYHNPVFYLWDGKIQKYKPAEDYPLDTVAPADGCGFGLCWTGIDAIVAVRESKLFDPEVGWFPDKRDAGGLGEDLSFCFMAMKAGVQLFVDTGIQAGHCGDSKVITRDDFIRCREEAKMSPTPGTW